MNRLLLLSLLTLFIGTCSHSQLHASQNEADGTEQTFALALYQPLLKSVGCMVAGVALYQYFTINEEILRSEDDSDAFSKAPEIEKLFKDVSGSSSPQNINDYVNVLKKGMKHDAKRVIIEHHLKTGRLAPLKKLLSPLLVYSPFDWKEQFKKVDKDHAAALTRACLFTVEGSFRENKDLTATYSGPASYYAELVNQRITAQNSEEKRTQFYLYKKTRTKKIDSLLQFYNQTGDQDFPELRKDLLRHIKNGGRVNTHTVRFEYSEKEAK